MRSINNFIIKTICFLVIIAASNSHLFSQALEVHLFEHSDYGGDLYPLNVNDCMKDCSYANNQWTDEISSVKVPDGYVLTIYDGNGHEFVGNCPELYCVGWGDGHWDNKNNGFSIKKLPTGWDAPANLPTGIYRFFNPYEGQYLTTGSGNLEEGQVGKNTNGHRQPDNSDNAFNFLLIRDEKTNDYTIVSLETGRNWRPQGSGKDYFSLKAGTPLEANHFSNADTWSNFTFQPVGTADIGVERRLFSIKTKGSDDYFLTLPCRDRGSIPTFEKGGKNTSQQWEIQLVEALPNLNRDYKLITEKNENIPQGKQMTMLEFLDEETTVPHKKMNIKVPFYAVNDSRFGFKKRMETYPIYILEREEFVIRKGSNKGWTINRRDKDIEFSVANSTSSTSGSSTSFNLGTSFSYSQETSVSGIFFDTKSTFTIGLTMGFDKSWHNSHTQSLTTTVKEWVSPCTKAAIYALATKITVRRADKNGNPTEDAPVAQWTYFDKNSVIYNALPLHPDECTTLSNEEYEKKLATWKRVYEKNTPTSTNTSTSKPPTTTTTANNNSNPTPKPTQTSTTSTNINPQQLVGKYQLQAASNGWHTGSISFDGKNLRWTNDAKRSWGLNPPTSSTATSLIVPTNEENPYYQNGAKAFEFIIENGNIKGFKFQNQMYHRVASNNSSNTNIAQKLIGKYQFQPATNGWHTGNISLNGNKLQWSNEAGKSWGLNPPISSTNTSIVVPTTAENPYYQSGAKTFEFVLDNGEVKGFKFQNQMYHRK